MVNRVYSMRPNSFITIIQAISKMKKLEYLYLNLYRGILKTKDFPHFIELFKNLHCLKKLYFEAEIRQVARAVLTRFYSTLQLIQWENIYLKLKGCEGFESEFKELMKLPKIQLTEYWKLELIMCFIVL